MSATANSRRIGAAMIGGVLLFGVVAAVSAHGRPVHALPVPAWLLGAAATLPLALSLGLSGTSAAKRLVVLALREATGLLGGLLTVLTADLSWVAALGSLSALALAAGLPREGDLSGR